MTPASSADEPVTGAPTAGATSTGATSAGARGGDDRVGAVAAPGSSGIRARLRQRRRLVIIGVVVAAALLTLAVCAGLVALVSRLDGHRDDARAERRATAGGQTACLELEKRLNRVAPPGAAPDATRRAAAIRDENAALRPYLTEIELRGPDHRDGDRLAHWRQLLDARSTFAEALDRQAATRTPAFFGIPRTPQGAAVADRLQRVSPAACAGPIRRLAAPDL